MPVKLLFLHIAETAFFDGRKMLCINGIFNETSAPKFPFVMPRFCISFGIRNFKGNIITIKIFSPSGTIVLDRKFDSKEVKEDIKDVTNVVLNLTNFIFPEAGKYQIKIFSENNEPVGSSEDYYITAKKS